jgi:hypothetical protein
MRGLALALVFVATVSNAALAQCYSLPTVDERIACYERGASAGPGGGYQAQPTGPAWLRVDTGQRVAPGDLQFRQAEVYCGGVASTASGGYWCSGLGACLGAAIGQAIRQNQVADACMAARGFVRAQ